MKILKWTWFWLFQFCEPHLYIKWILRDFLVDRSQNWEKRPISFMPDHCPQWSFSVNRWKEASLTVTEWRRKTQAASLATMANSRQDKRESAQLGEAASTDKKRTAPLTPVLYRSVWLAWIGSRRRAWKSHSKISVLTTVLHRLRSSFWLAIEGRHAFTTA